MAKEPLLDAAENEDDFKAGLMIMLKRNSRALFYLWMPDYITDIANTQPPRNQPFIIGGNGHRNLVSSLR